MRYYVMQGGFGPRLDPARTCATKSRLLPWVDPATPEHLSFIFGWPLSTTELDCTGALLPHLAAVGLISSFFPRRHGAVRLPLLLPLLPLLVFPFGSCGSAPALVGTVGLLCGGSSSSSSSSSKPLTLWTACPALTARVRGVPRCCDVATRDVALCCVALPCCPVCPAALSFAPLFSVADATQNTPSHHVRHGPAAAAACPAARTDDRFIVAECLILLCHATRIVCPRGGISRSVCVGFVGKRTNTRTSFLVMSW
jgi:hypothetical protein